MNLAMRISATLFSKIWDGSQAEKNRAGELILGFTGSIVLFMINLEMLYYLDPTIWP